MNHTPLRDLRRSAPRPLKQHQMAERIGCSQAMLSKFESGQDRLSDQQLRKYARALGVPEIEVAEAFELSAMGYYQRKFEDAKARVRALLGRKRSMATG